ncbi:putative ATP-dependent endonuclease [Candidatus Methanophagaceae archaeon]|nr:putative ATP-dependent endonuclease [Methanophagales archaeon]
MIEKLKLTNFRGIKEGEIELAPVTILLGANNSGKSTILEALFLAPNPFRKVPYVIGSFNSAAEVVHSIHESLSSEGYAFLLFNYTVNQAELCCKTDGKDYELIFTKNDPIIFALAKKQKTGTAPAINEDEKWETLGFGNMYLSNNDIKIIEDPKELLIDNTLLISSKLVQKGYNYLQRNWASIINLGICKNVAEEVSGLVYDNYRDITIEPFLGGKLAIYGFLEDGRRIRLGDLGEGIQSYIIARILYELEKPKVLLWDDIEAHLNPRMLLSIAEWFFDIVQNGDQVIITTHSLEAARTIASLNEEKTTIYLTSLEDNVLKSKRLTLKDMEDFLEAGIDVRVAEPLLL